MKSRRGLPLTRAGILRAALVLAVSAAPAVGRAQLVEADSLKPVRLMSSDPTLTVAVVYELVAGRFDKAHGLDVSVISAGGSSAIMIDAVASGNAEFANPGTLTALQAIRQGGNIRIIGAVATNQLTAVINNASLKKLDVSPSAPIADRIRALKGLTIGTNPVGSNYYQMTRSYVKQYGLDPDKDVKIIGVADTSALLSGVMQGRFDVIFTASGVVEQAIAQNAGTMWFSGARGDIPGSEKALVSLIVARADTIEKHAAEVDAFRAALTDALNAVNDDHEATGRALKQAYFPKMDQAVWDMAWANNKTGFPATLAFPREAYEYWITADPKGAESYKDVDYSKIVYPPAQVK